MDKWILGQSGYSWSGPSAIHFSGFNCMSGVFDGRRIAVDESGFGVGASFHLSYTVLKGNSHICRNKGTPACNFVRNSGLGGTFCFGKSIVETCCRLSSSKVDAQSVINWTVVGQLSWQYLRRPTASLSPVIVKFCPRHDSVARVS